jgi:O-antigen/teichoic acid export membrane protein
MVVAQILGTLVGSILTILASGRLYLPSFRAPIRRLVRDGLPYEGSLVAVSLAGLASSMIVAAQLGVRGVGLFAWCTILATPLLSALAAFHSVAAPTLARMRRGDGSRYDESVRMVTVAAGTLAAVGAGSLVGLVHPIVEFVFGSRWLAATRAVQFCLLGAIPTAILNALAADANARQLRRLTLLSALVGGAASLIVLVPLTKVAGVGGASAAAYCVGPTISALVFVLGLRVRIGVTVVRTLRLFAPLAAASVVLGGISTGPYQLAAACAVMAVIGVSCVWFAERALATRIYRTLRRSQALDPAM